MAKKLFRCPVWVVKHGKRVRCDKRLKSLTALEKHADKKHGGKGREI